MTEKSYFWDWDATPPTGDAQYAPYTMADFQLFYGLLFAYDRTRHGVIASGQYQTRPFQRMTEGSGVFYSPMRTASGKIRSPIPTQLTTYVGNLETVALSINSKAVSVKGGVAVVDGSIYMSDAEQTYRIYGVGKYTLIGLTKNTKAQTTRMFARGVYPSRSSALEALIQDEGITWEIPLAVVQTDSDGNVATIYDERRFIATSVFSPQYGGGAQKIQEIEDVVGGQTIEFNSIPDYFTHLILEMTTRSNIVTAYSNRIAMVINDEYNIYYNCNWYRDSSSGEVWSASTPGSPEAAIFIKNTSAKGNPADTWGLSTTRMWFHNYANPNIFKAMRWQSSYTADYQYGFCSGGGMYLSTLPVRSLLISAGATYYGGFDAGSVFALYGV